jgi:GNAT superfamily N-acetyltransferase
MTHLDLDLDLDLDLVCRLEAGAARAWPATIEAEAPGGWLLRATPGLDRGRSNCALTPCRPLEAPEIAPAIERVREFAGEHGIRPGIQVSPLEVHTALKAELDRLGWEGRWPTLVLSGPVAAGAGDVAVVATREADRPWLEAWARCEPGRDVEAHARTVFRLLDGRATFARIGSDAVAIGVPDDGLLGMFCLAVAPDRRRAGLGAVLVRWLLAAEPSARLAYLQVEERNLAARELYRRLGFEPVYRYCHRVSP